MTRSIIPDSLSGARVALALLALLLIAMARPAAAQNDLSMAAILSPVSGCTLAATENVTVRIFNFGSTLPAGTLFNASYTINGGAPVTELVVLATSLASNSQFAYTFTTQANLSTPGTYILNATVSLAGDISPANDALGGYLVTNSAPSAGGTIATPPPASSGTLTLSGNTGNVVQWEESDDGGSRWFVLSNAATTLGFASLRTQTKFRARVHNGACFDALSNVVTVTP